MCGRYTIHTKEKALAEAIGQALPAAYEPDYNIGPGSETLSIANRSKNNPVATMMHWGLRTPQNFHINARIETVDTSPRFRDSWHGHRCLIPANGFYEWYRDGVTKQPYYIYPQDQRIKLFAGLWFPSADRAASPTFVILTTQAQRSIQDIHERMPVILESEQAEAWLDGSIGKENAQLITQSIPLEKYTVSRRVNSVKNKDSRLIEATSPMSDDQMMLF